MVYLITVPNSGSWSTECDNLWSSDDGLMLAKQNFQFRFGINLPSSSSDWKSGKCFTCWLMQHNELLLETSEMVYLITVPNSGSWSSERDDLWSSDDGLMLAKQNFQFRFGVNLPSSSSNWKSGKCFTCWLMQHNELLLETNKAIKKASDAKIQKAKSGDVHDQPLTDWVKLYEFKIQSKISSCNLWEAVRTKLEFLKTGFDQNRSKTLGHQGIAIVGKLV